jgi:hypothetical protein
VRSNQRHFESSPFNAHAERQNTLLQKSRNGRKNIINKETQKEKRDEEREQIDKRTKADLHRTTLSCSFVGPWTTLVEDYEAF